MALIEWDDSFTVNVAAIDQEHKRFVAILNELNDAMNEGVEQDVLRGTLVGLIDYAATHFRTEEQYFAQFGYPDTESHKRDHAAFLQNCSAFIWEFERGNATIASDLMHYLHNWWKGHVLGTDKQYSQFLNDQGLK